MTNEEAYTAVLLITGMPPTLADYPDLDFDALVRTRNEWLRDAQQKLNQLGEIYRFRHDVEIYLQWCLHKKYGASSLFPDPLADPITDESVVKGNLLSGLAGLCR